MVKISGFYDEISSDLDVQLAAVKKYGEAYICPRSVDGKNIANYTVEEFAEKVKPRLDKAGVKFSSIGSPIGKIDINDNESYEEQKKKLAELVKIAQLMDCRYIRIFSFFINGAEADKYADEVVKKLKGFLELVEGTDVILLHENEKKIFGDTPERCLVLAKELYGEHFALAFDSSNFIQCDCEPLAAYELLKEYVAYVHVKDCSEEKVEVPLGLGEGRYEEILSDLILNRGYDGFLTLEPHTVKYSIAKKPLYVLPFLSLLPPLKHWFKVFRRIDRAYGKKPFQSVSAAEVFDWQYQNLKMTISDIYAEKN